MLKNGNHKKNNPPQSNPGSKPLPSPLPPTEKDERIPVSPDETLPEPVESRKKSKADTEPE